MASKGSSGGVLHAGSIRMSINGSGVLRTNLFSKNDARMKTVPNINLDPITDKEPTKPTNFNSQQICVEFRVTGASEYFILSRIVVFVKPIASGWPGRV